MKRSKLESWTMPILAAMLAASALMSPSSRSETIPVRNADLLQQALDDPVKGVEEIVFANRLSYEDGHWYANIGYYCDDENKMAYAGNGKPDVGRLCKLNLKSGKITVLIDAQGGSIRDPVVHYDALKILFSWRKSDSIYYNLYEVNIDGTNLKQITSGPFDDYEPAYLPNDDIVFVSTRCKRWVNCWKTQVGILYRCQADGGNIHAISTNIEHDNTPAILPDGRVLYTRWEYVDRSQVGYHHLWTMNPDGTGQSVFYGNQRHYPLFIASKPIPGSQKVVGIDSPGHGRRDHYGFVSIFDPAFGPNDKRGIRRISKKQMIDPYPLSEDSFLAAQGKKILLLNGLGQTKVIHTSVYNCYEPSPIRPRPREDIRPSRTIPDSKTGIFVLSDVYNGRSLGEVKRGEIKKLLVLESLPKPVNFSGGPDLLSWLGTFTLERVLGTAPVEEDGSAYFEAPANRPLFFVALDENDLSVKRMQSFVSVRPGEVLSCAGCHEDRDKSPVTVKPGTLMATRREPSRIQPFAGYPDVLDFNRDIQPILDRRCVSCHNYEQRDGEVSLVGDLGPQWSLSFYTLFARLQIADARNGYGNQPPRTIGSSASRLMNKIDGTHYEVKLTKKEWRTIWLWIESAAPYAGSYAALRNEQEMKLGPLSGRVLSEQQGVLQRRCFSCHNDHKATRIPFFAPAYPDKRGITRPTARHERLVIENDPLARFSVHAILNLSHPEHSALLLAPLAKESGGWARCGTVFESTTDPDYRRLLQSMVKAKRLVDTIPRYATTEFKPNRQYIREMKKYGVLPSSFDLDRVNTDHFKIDQKYWRLFW